MVTLSGNRNFIKYIQESEPATHEKGDLWLATGSGSDKGLKKSTGNAFVSVFSENISGDIGIFGGGRGGASVSYNEVNIIDQVTISSPGNATDFGDLTDKKKYLSATSNGTSDTGIFGGGEDIGSNYVNTIDQVTISSAGNAIEFGDLTDEIRQLAATSNGTSDTGIFTGGEKSTQINSIDQVTISSASNATDFGDLTDKRDRPSSISNGTSDTGIIGAGWSGAIGFNNIIDQVTISSAGNATDFGDLTVKRYSLSATSNGISDTGIFGGGRDNSNNRVNTIDQVTISSAGNATNFGDLTDTKEGVVATSNGVNDTGIFGGGDDADRVNIIDQVTISSAGNATDFGDLTVEREDLSATSNGLL